MENIKLTEEAITHEDIQQTNENNTEIQMLSGACERLFGCGIEEAAPRQMYKALCSVVHDLLAAKRKKFHNK